MCIRDRYNNGYTRSYASLNTSKYWEFNGTVEIYVEPAWGGINLSQGPGSNYSSTYVSPGIRTAILYNTSTLNNRAIGINGHANYTINYNGENYMIVDGGAGAAGYYGDKFFIDGSLYYDRNYDQSEGYGNNGISGTETFAVYAWWVGQVPTNGDLRARITADTTYGTGALIAGSLVNVDKALTGEPTSLSQMTLVGTVNVNIASRTALDGTISIT